MAADSEGFTIGADLGGTRLKYGLFGKDGASFSEENVASEADRGVDHVIQRMVDLFKALIQTSGRRKPVKCLGLGIAGLIDGWNGIVRIAPNLPGWRDVPLKAILEERLEIPVMMDNDANVAALAEYHFGAGRGVNMMMMVTLGTGVGGGFVFDGAIFRGRGGLAGEFGHTVVNFNGPLCHCGSRGCVEAYIGNYAILRRFFEKLDQGASSDLASARRDELTVETLSLAAQEGDDTARSVFREAGEALGIGLANVVNLLNIERFVIGGGVAAAGALIMDPAREALAGTAFEASAGIVDLVPAALGNRAGMIGAAWMARSRM